MNVFIIFALSPSGFESLLHVRQNLELRCSCSFPKYLLVEAVDPNPRQGQVALPGDHLRHSCHLSSLASHDLPRLRIRQWALGAFRSPSHNGVIEVHQGFTIHLGGHAPKNMDPLTLWGVMLRLDTEEEKFTPPDGEPFVGCASTYPPLDSSLEGGL